tara:strand:+ start:2409 stop:3791 length:1383 start_codon:yes stop_codon:yes gene_type:complete
MWKPHPGAQTLALSVSNTYETLYGGARGGGKTDAGMVWLLRDSENPKLRGLVIRKNAEDLSDWIDRAREMYPNAVISGKPAVIRFPSGAIIRTGHLKDDSAYTKYQGHEYHRMVLEELTQIPTEESYLKLISSCRSTVPGLEARIFATANPGGKGHAWVKQRFIDGKKQNEAFQDKVSGRLRIYIPATVDDNPTLSKNDPQYVNFLNSLPEPLRSAWRNGDWNVYAGQYFTEFTQDVHVIEPPDDFGSIENARFIGIDWGFANPFCALWAEVTPKGKIYFYRELYGTEKRPYEWGKEIAELSREDRVSMSLGDPSMWIRNPHAWKHPEVQMHSDASIADSLLSGGVPNLVPANNTRVPGWMKISDLLHWDNEGKEPDMYIIKGTCPNLARTMPLALRCNRNPEDIDTDGEDHALDACRYLIMHLKSPDTIKPIKPQLQQDIEKLMAGEEAEEYYIDWDVV